MLQICWKRTAANTQLATDPQLFRIKNNKDITIRPTSTILPQSYLPQDSSNSHCSPGSKLTSAVPSSSMPVKAQFLIKQKEAGDVRGGHRRAPEVSNPTY